MLQGGETHIVATEIGLELACKDLESGAFADTVSTHESEDLAGSWCW